MTQTRKPETREDLISAIMALHQRIMGTVAVDTDTVLKVSALLKEAANTITDAPPVPVVLR